MLPLFRNIHHSPDNFADPENFDPSRFEVGEGGRPRRPYLHQSPFLLLQTNNSGLFFVDCCRLLQNPTLSCHLETGPIPALAMNSRSWRCSCSSITSPPNTGNPAKTIKSQIPPLDFSSPLTSLPGVDALLSLSGGLWWDAKAVFSSDLLCCP